VTRWDPDDAADPLGVPKEIMDEIYALRHEVNELHERVDFAERLLAGRGESGGGGPTTRGLP
jgi:hypothetical protein